jgi:restriction endonuclease S subunit
LASIKIKKICRPAKQECFTPALPHTCFLCLRLAFVGTIANKPSRTNMILIKPGDLVIPGINVSKGAMGVYQGSEGVTATIHYSSHTFDTEKIDVEYFKRFLKSELFITLLKDQIKGGIKTEIKPKHILPLEIDLPNIDEQRKMVKHFENVEKEDSELKQELNSQQILQEAIEGKLTKEWRTKKQDVEPASELLERIKIKEEELIKEKKIKKQKPLQPITNDEKPSDLPDGWAWCRLGEVVRLNPRNYIDNELNVSFIPMNLIADGFKNSHKAKKKKWKEIKTGFTHFAENDVVVSKITPCFQNRKSAVMKNLDNYFGAGTTELFVLRSYDKTIIPEYILAIVKSEDFIERGTKTYKGTVGQQRIQKDFLKNYLISLPPFSEQKVIVEKVNKLLSICDKLEDEINKNKQYSEELMQAVLREAFNQNESAEVK